MKKTSKQQKTHHLTQRQQWGIVTLLVAILFVFAFLVYGFDLIWNAQASS